MDNLLYFSAFLTFTIGVAHSVLGERYILIRLSRRDNLPKLFGSADFTMRTLRFVWHLLTVAWWGFAVVLVLLAHPPLSISTLGAVIAAIFLIHFVVALLGSHGKHLSWIVFLIIAVCTLYATR